MVASFFSYSKEELADLLESEFQTTSFRAEQLFEWCYKQHQFDSAKWSNIKQDLRASIAERLSFDLPSTAARQISSDGTRKYMFGLTDGKLIESVMIKQPKRMTLCVSSQVGCAMACAFCRTGTMKLHRHLSTAEIISQVMAVIIDAKNFSDMFSNIVFMGMGEPLHNYDALVRAVKILNDPSGLNIPGRKITVSSVGLVPAIKKFATSGAKANLAVSLNATHDEQRSKIMPINKRFPIAELLDTVKTWCTLPRQKVTIEYVMLHGFNDTAEDLSRLRTLLRNLPVKLNLIPYNENAGLGFKSPPKELVHRWQQGMYTSGINTTIRWSKGRDIDAACGQLATVIDKANKVGSQTIIAEV